MCDVSAVREQLVGGRRVHACTISILKCFSEFDVVLNQDFEIDDTVMPDRMQFQRHVPALLRPWRTIAWLSIPGYSELDNQCICDEYFRVG